MNHLSIELITILLVGLLIYWVIKLKKEIKRGAKTELKLIESEEKFRKLFDIVPVMFASFDKNGKCVLWNKECQRVFGWSIEEINSSTNAMAMFCPDVSVQNDVFTEWCSLTKDGKKIVTMWATMSIPSNADVITIGYDITNQRDVEIELQNKTEQLKDAKNKLAQLNESLQDKIKVEVEKNKQHQKSNFSLFTKNLNFTII